MNTNFYEAREYIAKAREALQRGEKESARKLGQQASLLAPNMEDAWLVLTASEANPKQALAYARKALEIHPESVRARRGLEWALARAKQIEITNALVKQSPSLPKHRPQVTIPSSQFKISGQNWLYPALLIGAACLLVGLAGIFAWTSPTLASMVSNSKAPISTQENHWAVVDIAKPTITPMGGSVLAPELADAPTSAPSDGPISVPMDIPTLAATETPAMLVMEIVADDSTGQTAPPVETQALYPAEGNGERWIDVNLSEQMVYAYEGDVIVNSFLVSTGVAQTPTVTGKYEIYVKVRIQDMSGPGYYLPNVPWVMYFYEEYGFHGTYWHNNFGTPMSRGCVNMRIDDAAWLYSWASVGTLVNVHY